MGIFSARNRFMLACCIVHCSHLYSYSQKKKKTGKKTILIRMKKNIVVAVKFVNTRYNHLFDGKYYLTKMYICEALEHVQQVYSLIKIYFCLMPVEISIIVCAVLTVELLIIIWATSYNFSRNTG